MATLLLSAAGTALGSGFGGTVLGLSGAVIGRAVGATVGRVLDQRILGAGSEPVEVGRVNRLQLTGAGEGDAITRIWGRMRVAGQVIWATQFLEDVTRTGGGKGTAKPGVSQYSYSVSLAVALCRGEILGLGRVWADGAEIAPSDLALRVYTGSETQLPDPKIAAIEGPGLAPAYRGLAYVMIEDLDLTPYGNRVPQFTFEVIRRAAPHAGADLVDAVRGVALIPGTGEYGLATTPVHYQKDAGVYLSANVHSPSGLTDFATSLQQLETQAPRCAAVALVVSWFGDDLRCGSCLTQPKVEDAAFEGAGMPWRAGGITRAQAQEVPRVAGRSIYGGTPADAAVLEAMATLKAAGKDVMFYPFLLMEQLVGNSLPDPWTGIAGQPALPWRGRISLAVAPGRQGSVDGTAAAAAQVAAFFGTAAVSDFSVSGGLIAYSGPAQWSYRRFILHYAHLCALAGGVESFCIGSELRSLTQIRGAANSFPAVEALRQLAADVRGILGVGVKISYAADWSEYFGYHVGADLYFHLDPLWADANIDFVGIDNYVPLSDWRDEPGHADEAWGTIYNLDYLKANIAGGEGFDWYYDSAQAAVAQRRIPITDGAYGEPWVFRNKDLKSWWSNQHFNRVGGVRGLVPTTWVPESKPFRFTEYGCGAVDKGTNQPNVFLDPKSSESSLPRASTGRRDDLIQMQYLRAYQDFFSDAANNPASRVTGAPMVDMGHAFVWSWDTRPFPDFPAQISVWGDGENFGRGHWINGRITNQSLAAVVAEICAEVGQGAVDVSRLYGVVRGYALPEVGTVRAALQPLMLAYGFDANERDGVLRFSPRTGEAIVVLEAGQMALTDDVAGAIEAIREPEAEVSGRVRVGFVGAEGQYDLRFAEASFPDETSLRVSQSELPMVLLPSEARSVAERWLAEARVARDTARFALPRSRLALGAGDVVEIGDARYRIDRLELGESHLVDAVRVEPGIYSAVEAEDTPLPVRPFVAPVPVFPVFLDLPLLTGTEVPHAPHVAIAAQPWPGSATVWAASSDAGYEVNRVIAAPALMGLTETPLDAARPGLLDRGAPLRVRLTVGALSSATMEAVLNGANVAAIGAGDGRTWEVFQYVDAVLVAPFTYDLSFRLRGQQGTDGIMPPNWPVGSRVVFLDRTVQQIDLPLSVRGLARYYRIGASARGYADPNTVLRVEAFDGVGLRPYPVAHLTARRLPNGDVAGRWVRRGRIDADSWQSTEIPLGEDREAYVVRIVQGNQILGEVGVSAAECLLSAATLAQFGASGGFALDVAQTSDRFGPGPFRSIEVPA